MPKLSDTMEEGKILKWLVKQGDTVSSGDVIAEIETDKADMELEAFDDGVVLKIVLAEGESAPVGELIALIGEEGEEVEAPPKAGKVAKEEKPVEEESEEEKKPPAEKPVPKPAEQPEEVEIKEKAVPVTTPPPAPADVKASPVALKLAAEAGLEITKIPGSGPGGRVVKRDVESYIVGEIPAIEPKLEAAPKPVEAPSAAPLRPKLAGKRVPMSMMRKTIAKRMTESKTTVPHFYLTISVDMAPVMETRKVLEEQEGAKISVNDFIIKACAKALVEHEQVNAHIEDNEIVYHDSVDIGVAVALEEGLITPVVRGCDNKNLAAISTEVAELAERARARKLDPVEYTGAGFTVSNLGMFGIEQFAAIINPPEATILAVGRVEDVPVAKDGQITVGTRMKMTLSCDHRVVDGAVGARFLATVKEILEHPMRMLI